MVRIGSYSSEIPPDSSSNSNSTQNSSSSNIHEEFKKYQDEQRKAFEEYKSQQQKEFENYKSSLGIDIKYNPEKSIPQNPPIKPLETFDISDNEFIQMTAYTDEAPKTGGIYAEYDEKTGITTTYNKNTNTITKTDADGNILSRTDFDGKSIEAQPKDGVVEATVKKEKPHLADYITGISDETKAYLKADKRFNTSNEKYIELAVSKVKKEKELRQAKQEMQECNVKLKNTPYDDFEALSINQKKYFEATKKVEYLQGELTEIKAEQGTLVNMMVNYANTIENWEDNTQAHIHVKLIGLGERSGVYDRTYTRVTLPSGEKAYEWNGEYYQIGSDRIQPSLFSKVET